MEYTSNFESLDFCMAPNTLLHTKVRENLYTYTHYVTAPIFPLKVFWNASC